MADNFSNVFEDLKSSTWIQLQSRFTESTTSCDLSIDIGKMQSGARHYFTVRLEDSGLGQVWRQRDTLFMRVKARDPQELRELMLAIIKMVKTAEADSGQVA